MNEPIPELECVIPKDEFEKLREDRQFATMLQLGRYHNQLSYSLASVPVIPDPNRATYRETRQLVNAILLGSAILFEGIGQLRAAAPQFKWYRAYRDVYRPFIRNAATHSLRERFLEHFRNKMVSHVDLPSIMDTLKWADYKEYVFLGGVGGTIYYPLADNIGFTGAMGPHTDDESEMETIVDYFTKWSDISVEFNKVVNTILIEYIEKKGWSRRERTYGI